MSHPEHGGERSTEALIQEALEGGEEDERAWAAISALRHRGTREVLDASLRLLESPSARARGRGADILAQLGGEDSVFPAERGAALLALLRLDDVIALFEQRRLA